MKSSQGGERQINALFSPYILPHIGGKRENKFTKRTLEIVDESFGASWSFDTTYDICPFGKVIYKKDIVLAITQEIISL